MKLKTIGSIAAVSLMLVTVRPLVAHHSFDAEYDSKKPINLTGYVTKLDWVNPHAFVFIDTKDESGTVKIGAGGSFGSGRTQVEKLKMGSKATAQRKISGCSSVTRTAK